jgi:acetyl esterase/lipase
MKALKICLGIATLAFSAGAQVRSTTAPTLCLAVLLADATPPRELVYKTVGSQALKLYCFQPADLKAGDHRTAIVWIHGGGWTAGGADAFFPHARYYATRGAVAFSLEYRLVKPDGPLLADSLADCKSAIRYLRTHAAELGIDPKRIVVLGDSAGGHLSACLGTIEGFDDPADDRRVSAVPDAMVLYNPIVDMTQQPHVKIVIGGNALQRHPPAAATQPSAKDLELAKKLSPLFSVRPQEPPALVMHGSEDHVVSPEQSKQFAAAMTAAGNDCQLIIVPSARHAFVVPKYTASEPVVVQAIRAGDQFLIARGFLDGEPTLVVSQPPAWVPKVKR